MTWSIFGRGHKKVSRLSLQSRENGVHSAYTEMANDVDEQFFTKIINTNFMINDNKWYISTNSHRSLLLRQRSLILSLINVILMPRIIRILLQKLANQLTPSLRLPTQKLPHQRIR